MKNPIRAARAQANLTQAQFAELLGCHENTIRGWERGSPPAKRYWDRLNDMFGIPRARLIRWYADPSQVVS